MHTALNSDDGETHFNHHQCVPHKAAILSQITHHTSADVEKVKTIFSQFLAN